MSDIKILHGDISDEGWSLETGKLTTGFYNIKEIPMAEIERLEIIETIKEEYHVYFLLSNGKQFVASMSLKIYEKCLEDFNNNGNKPKYIELPKLKKSKYNVVSLVFVVIVIVAYFSSFDTRPKECDYLADVDLKTREWNTEYSSCSSDYLMINANKVNDYGIANNIAYYYKENQGLLVLNMNVPTSTEREFNKLLSSANELSLKTSGFELPAEMVTAIHDHSLLPISMTNQKYRWKLVKDTWINGKGYELRFSINEL